MTIFVEFSVAVSHGRDAGLESFVCLGSSDRTEEVNLPETTYDIAIIGSGPAGYTAAIRAGQHGLKTALIEKDNVLGGTCLHVGCIPTKALLFNAEIWDHLKDAKEFGIEGVDARKLNWAAIQDRKSKIVGKHAKGLEFLMKKNKVEMIRGYGKLTCPAQNGVISVEVTNDGKTAHIRAKSVILSTGSEARMLPGLKADDRILTNIEILALKEIPKSLVIVGAGAVGVEFASIYSSFGCEVTILEMLPRLVPIEDEEISKELARVFRKRGINFHTSAKVEKIDKTKSGITVTFTVDNKQQKIEAEKTGYNVKIGKLPFTANSRASIVGAHEGFIKIVSDADYGEILGVHIIGPQATELIAEAVAAMEAEATVEDLMWTIHAHPTLAEAMLDAANSVYGMAINA